MLSIAYVTDILDHGQTGPFLKHAAVACLLLGAFLAIVSRRLWLYPKPLPGIPYNVEATGNLLGDIPSLAQWQKTHGETRRWFQAQFRKLNSPVVQVFVYPFKKPEVLLGDHREIRDILLRRHREFDRGSKEPNAFGALLPQQLLSIKTPTAKFKFHKELMKDLMLPQFLSTVNGPVIYQKAMTLVELWKAKAQIAQQRPFDVKQDLYKLAYDIIMAISFGLSDESSCTRTQLRALLSEKASRPATTEGSS
ncbi:uncharacterized protein PV07_11185 [Cladophialophora immunda]|uniref:Cytochrome P450 n=1 Tax=Cladophialophora immunda TaxID=569365 RepID=A0A0D2ADH6_9EURO|nr:uncharacterized protein PV07_11185 [Cladophialophora immunda]KIW22942.1 hypothetical protein PV07_11185 [Cladophialophora immunda]